MKKSAGWVNQWLQPACQSLNKENMNLHSRTAELFIPDQDPESSALARTTHLCIAAHQDDVEIMAAQPIIECFQQQEKWFTAVVVTDGRGSPRMGLYGKYTDEEMRLVRIKEQRKAAVVGEYAAQVFLDYPSESVKDGNNPEVIDDLSMILKSCNPGIVFTHNLADKHDTHMAVALRVIQAIRKLDKKERPNQLIGCEVWRSLDWLVDTDKVVLNVSDHENLQNALLGIFDSQIAGGKRYDLATMGRRRANATYFESHGVDNSLGLTFAMDMSLLIKDDNLDPAELIQGFIQRMEQDIAGRLKKLI
jgi:LmbE family N-acetylglucosaminyl deacetylase